jgi:hypothetical protein
MPEPVSYFCMSTFGHYGTFAVLPLYTAIMIDGTYSIDGFIASFRVSGDEHVGNSKLGAFMKRLVYETSDTFTTEEIRFFLRMS